MKIMILGVGAQGSTVARRMALEDKVTEITVRTAIIRCRRAGQELKKKQRSGNRCKKQDSLLKCRRWTLCKCPAFAFCSNVLEAALSVKANYQDFAATDVLTEKW